MASAKPATGSRGKPARKRKGVKPDNGNGGSGRTPSKGYRRRDISLPTWYDEQINERMRVQGIGRSEAVRQFINEARGRNSQQLRHHIRTLCSSIKLEAMAVRGMTSSQCAEHLAVIDAAADKISALLGEASVL